VYYHYVSWLYSNRTPHQILVCLPNCYLTRPPWVSYHVHHKKGRQVVNLSRTAGYALRATLQLAQADKGVPITCRQLAAEGNLPERFLLQILRNLVSHGILSSVRGASGGYMLVLDPKDISLLALIEAMDGPLVSSVPSGKWLPPDVRKKLGGALKDITETYRQELAAVRLTSLLPKPVRRKKR
jgi:Rrf2 family protein